MGCAVAMVSSVETWLRPRNPAGDFAECPVVAAWRVGASPGMPTQASLVQAGGFFFSGMLHCVGLSNYKFSAQAENLH